MDSLSSLVLLILIMLCSFAGGGSAEKAEALFVFGDSLADTGNRSPYNHSVNQPWRRPYGLTWPGQPAGRYSSGKIQTDFLADILGIPSPVPYELLRRHNCSSTTDKIRWGVNFAVGGSGIFRAYGFTTVPEQVKQFKKLIAGSSAFDSRKLSRSVVLISVAGNDYNSYKDSRNGSIEGLESLAKPVVIGLVDVVKDLYHSGLRNFVVSNVGPLGCLPEIGKTSCDSRYDHTIAHHSRLLTQSVNQLKLHLKALSIILPDMVSAFHHVFSHPAQYGFVDLFVPCCAEKGGVGMCAEVDEKGKPLFEVCGSVDDKFFWDAVHPTHKGWYTLMSLYSYGASASEKTKKVIFIEGTSNIIEWVLSLGFHANNISAKV